LAEPGFLYILFCTEFKKRKPGSKSGLQVKPSSSDNRNIKGAPLLFTNPEDPTQRALEVQKVHQVVHEFKSTMDSL
jgi:hypothetical protein